MHITNNKYSVKLFYVFLLFSFKAVLRHITCSMKDTITFMQKHQILRSSMTCPGPFFKGKRHGGCGKPMCLKETNDSRDIYVWRCRKNTPYMMVRKKLF